MSRYGRLRKRPTVEGRRAVIEALRAGREIEQILMQDDADLGPQLREIVFLANGAGITVNGVSRHDLDRQSATRKHQGCDSAGSRYPLRADRGPGIRGRWSQRTASAGGPRWCSGPAQPGRDRSHRGCRGGTWNHHSRTASGRGYCGCHTRVGRGVGACARGRG